MLGMNLYSYIKAQNYEGFEVDVVRKILIQLMQALFFLHKVAPLPGSTASYTATSNPKMWCSRRWASRG